MSAIRTPLRSIAAAFALGATFGAVQAQGYPAKPISLIVPFSAGGGVDATARQLSAKLGEVLKQPVVIENVAGAAGTIGTQKVARAPADGYTLLFAVASPLNVAPLVAPSAVRYDTFKDFVPVATVGTAPFVLIGKPALPASTAAELVGAEVILTHCAEVKVTHLGEDDGLCAVDVDPGASSGDTSDGPKGRECQSDREAVGLLAQHGSPVLERRDGAPLRPARSAPMQARRVQALFA